MVANLPRKISSSSFGASPMIRIAARWTMMAKPPCLAACAKTATTNPATPALTPLEVEIRCAECHLNVASCENNRQSQGFVGNFCGQQRRPWNWHRAKPDQPQHGAPPFRHPLQNHHYPVAAPDAKRSEKSRRLPQFNAQVVVGIGEVGVDVNGLGEMSNRLVGAPLGRERRAARPRAIAAQ